MCQQTSATEIVRRTPLVSGYQVIRGEVQKSYIKVDGLDHDSHREVEKLAWMLERKVDFNVELGRWCDSGTFFLHAWRCSAAEHKLTEVLDSFPLMRDMLLPLCGREYVSPGTFTLLRASIFVQGGTGDDKIDLAIDKELVKARRLLLLERL